jgi:hypothetical protein
VDWYHVVEKLWAAGEALYSEGSDELRERVADQSERLRRSAVGAIRAELARQLLVPAQDRAWQQGQAGSPCPPPYAISTCIGIGCDTPSYASVTSTLAPEWSSVRCAISSGYASMVRGCARVAIVQSAFCICAAF